jgi:nitric oxide reductase large subunit
MASDWTVDTLKEYFESLLIEKDKALSAALIAVKEENRKTETAAEKRFELLNELRSGVATKDQMHALEKMVDDLKTSRDRGEGKGQGGKDVMDIIKLVIVIAGFILAYFVIK